MLIGRSINNDRFCLPFNHFFPIILLVQKIWVSYSIDNALRINHSKTYIRKNKGDNLFVRFFRLDFKDEISQYLFVKNLFISVGLLVSIILGVEYLVKYFISYPTTKFDCILANGLSCYTIIIWTLHMCINAYKKIVQLIR